MSTLLDKIAELPAFVGAKRRRKWTQYRPAYVALLNKDYPPAEACRFIADTEGLNQEEETKLYNVAKKWKGIRSPNQPPKN